MQVFENISQLRAFLAPLRAEHTIGLVPTMGALHQGHISLVEELKPHCSLVVATIFVNPAQFNNPEDLANYPSDQLNDLAALEQAGVDVVFTPSASEIYSGQTDFTLSFGEIESELEGRFRPGHFAGVGLVISKLLNIVQPQFAIFGQKDLQQYYVIRKLVEQLFFPVQIIKAPTEREPSGLALSSRNRRLNTEQLEEATLLYNALSVSRKKLLKGESIASVKKAIEELFFQSESLVLEYFEVIETRDFKPIMEISDPENTALCIAAEIGNVRLIDNFLLID